MIGSAVNFLILHATIVIPVVLVVLLILSKSMRAGAATGARVVARLCLIGAVLALVYDGTLTMAGGSGLVVTSLADHWQAFHPTSLAAFKNVLNQLHPKMWDQAGLRLVKLPAWVVVGGLGFLLAWIGRKRRPVNVYIN